MPKRRKILIAIADGEHARFLRPGEGGALLEQAVFQSSTAHMRSAELRTDHPGAAFHSDSSAHHALAPETDPKTLEKETFAEVVAGRLNAEAAEGTFDALILVAPPHSLNAIRRHLAPATAARMVGGLAKDLIKVPDAKLWLHLRRWVRPARQGTR